MVKRVCNLVMVLTCLPVAGASAAPGANAVAANIVADAPAANALWQAAAIYVGPATAVPQSGQCPSAVRR